MKAVEVDRFGSINCFCTFLQISRAIGLTKNGMGCVGMVMNTSFITSQFINEPSAKCIQKRACMCSGVPGWVVRLAASPCACEP